MNKERIQRWASKNAYTLLFILILFVITWSWILFTVVFLGGGVHGK